ncbi:hypothetical protein HAX54_044021 [Datura stramonium]|uniref:Uncharacterized protein n=1 Tax=Datura stramonium TaxID=4076 RepID=A0ABS8W254_DATST|nr:hypothetical protein [Datura stramonium]
MELQPSMKRENTRYPVPVKNEGQLREEGILGGEKKNTEMGCDDSLFLVYLLTSLRKSDMYLGGRPGMATFATRQSAAMACVKSLHILAWHLWGSRDKGAWA